MVSLRLEYWSTGIVSFFQVNAHQMIVSLLPIQLPVCATAGEV